ncbi:sulfatase [Thalassospira sp. MA62]|nr:sulfatase [Thalassospira sp. MA62]
MGYTAEWFEKIKKLFLLVNKPILVTYCFFIIYRISTFSYYMEVDDFLTFVAVTFLGAQVLCLFLSSLIMGFIALCGRIYANTGVFDRVCNFVNYGGYGISIFAFTFSMERIFIAQSWLNYIHIAPVLRAVIEMLFGIGLFALMIWRCWRSDRGKGRQAPSEPSAADLSQHTPGQSAGEKHLNRRLFLTTSASAIAAATVGTRIVMGNQFGLPINPAFPPGDTGRKNILLVTFDALSATDMSLYGYGLKTTPHIDAFATSSTVHRNFYACSTFTTPGISSILTGRYPSQSGIHQLAGMLHGSDIYRTLPAQLKSVGYKTAAIFGNPYAMPLMGSTQGAFDHLCAAPRAGWTDFPPSELMELPGMMDMITLADRMKTVSGLVIPPFQQMASETPPKATFDAAKNLIAQMEGPFFIWLHVMAPHAPYLPSDEFRHRFLKPGLLETRQDMLHPAILDRSKTKSQIQTDIEHTRLRYDEWISEADSAFGHFIADLEKTGVMDNTMTMVSADHGEFFSPRTFGHAGRVFHKSLIHVPMIVRMPGQQSGKHIDTVADQTAIAPTILREAGLTIPDWMPSSPLRGFANDQLAGGDKSAMAITQYLARTSSFGPIVNGTVGSMTDAFQYVRNIETGDEKLFVVGGATAENGLENDRIEVTGDMPHVVEQLREALKEAVPDAMV